MKKQKQPQYGFLYRIDMANLWSVLLGQSLKFKALICEEWDIIAFSDLELEYSTENVILLKSMARIFSSK